MGFIDHFLPPSWMWNSWNQSVNEAFEKVVCNSRNTTCISAVKHSSRSISATRMVYKKGSVQERTWQGYKNHVSLLGTDLQPPGRNKWWKRSRSSTQRARLHTVGQTRQTEQGKSDEIWRACVEEFKKKRKEKQCSCFASEASEMGKKRQKLHFWCC